MLDREIFVRTVRTNPRYPPIDAAALDEAAQASMTALMAPGTLILQTPAKANLLQELPAPTSAQSTLSLPQGLTGCYYRLAFTSLCCM